MNAKRLHELLGEYALERPERPLSQVTALEFAAWYTEREAETVRADLARWDKFEKHNRSLPASEQVD